MVITTDPLQKFAFLLSGSDSARYLKDIKMVYDTLTLFYNYPKSNIWVLFPNASTDPYYSGSNRHELADYEVQTANFIAAADIDAMGNPDNAINTSLIYFTGDGVNNNPTYELTLKGVGSLTSDWLEMNFFVSDGQFNFVMQQAYSGGFLGAVNNIGATYYSFTGACSNGEDNSTEGDLNGSYFTKAWVNSLRLLKSATLMKYADEITQDNSGNPIANTPPEFHITLEQAKIYAVAETSALSSTPQYQDSNNIFCLGSPKLLIRDGDHPGIGLSPYRSPDIFITHPLWVDAGNAELPGNQYIQDIADEIDNLIHVRVFNYGTHPVRKCYVGMSRFATGGGGTHEDRVNFEDIVTEDPANPGTYYPQVLCPLNMTVIDTNVIPADDAFSTTDLMKINSYISQFDDVRFPESNHRCIKAVAKMTKIELTDTDAVDNELDDWVWNFMVNYDEAQLNTDYAGITDPSYGGGGGGSPAPEVPGGGNGAEDEAIPENADDEEKTEAMNNKLRGFKEHIYEIRNPFKEKRKFILSFPKQYNEYSKKLKLEWFEFKDHNERELVPLEIIEEPYNHVIFDLEPGELKKVLLYFALRTGVDFNEENLTFEILTEHRKLKDKSAIREPHLKEFRENYARWMGFELTVRKENTSLFGKVFDPEGKPVQNAKILVQTANRRQSAIIRSNRNGEYKIPNINPDVYKITALTDEWHTKVKFITLPALKEGRRFDFTDQKYLTGLPVRVIIDKIRILNNHEIFFKKEGEFIFKSITVPDKNRERTKEVKIPEKGIIPKSDKPGKNEIELGITVFEGVVSESLLFRIEGIEKDKVTNDDKLNFYQRYFAGNPGKWYGKYSPFDEYNDKEDVGDWQIWFRIVRM